MIHIEAFPLISSRQVTDAITVMRTPSKERGDCPFSSVAHALKTEKLPVRAESERPERGESLQLLGTPATTARMVDVENNLLFHPELHDSSQKDATLHLSETGQNKSGEGQTGAFLTAKHLSALLGKTVPQITCSTEGSGTGLDADEAAQLLEMYAAASRGGEKEAFLARLMTLMEGQGVTAAQAREIRKLIADLQVKGGSLMSAEEKQADELKNLLLKTGMSPGEADKAVKDGEVSPIVLKKIMARLGISAEEVSKAVAGEKTVAAGLKTVMAQPGVKPEHLNTLLAQTSNGRSAVLPKELLEALNSIINSREGYSVTAAPGRDVLFPGSGSGGYESRGESDVAGGNRYASGANSEKAVAGVPQNRGDFDQVMSRIIPRGPVAQKVMEQIVEGARIQVASGQTRAKIVLDPPSLGKLSLQIITKDDQVRVTFFAESLQVKEIIESNLAQLRQSFVQQGLRLADLGVFVGHHPGGNAAEQQTPFGRLENDSSGLDGSEGKGNVIPEDARPWSSGNHTIDLFV